MQIELEQAFLKEDNSKLEELSRLSKIHRIDAVEKILGQGDAEKGKVKISHLLKCLTTQNFLSNEIGNMLGKNRHVIRSWLKRYGLKTANYEGNKKSILIFTLNKDKIQTNHGRYETIANKLYRTYYANLDQNVSYIIGLIFGDGSIDGRKVYVTGGGKNKSSEYIDRIYRQFRQFSENCNSKTIRIKYFNKQHIPVQKNNKNMCYWRMFFYWSAFSNFFNEKDVLNKCLQQIWENKESFDAFTAGLFDSDGYFTLRRGKPERICIEQKAGKSWFNIYAEKFNKYYLQKTTVRSRKYNIPYGNGKFSSGIIKLEIIEIRMSNWPNFINDVVLKHCNKPIHRERAEIFKERAVKMKERWKYI